MEFIDFIGLKILRAIRFYQGDAIIEPNYSYIDFVKYLKYFH